MKAKTTETPTCTKCGDRMLQSSEMSTRFAASIFVCSKCNTIQARDADGKPFVPTISTR